MSWPSNSSDPIMDTYVDEARTFDVTNPTRWLD
jgi:hypothetical protein